MAPKPDNQQQQQQTQDPSAKPDADPTQGAEDWEQKYKSLQGMFNAQNAETNQLRQEMQQEAARGQRLEATLATMNQKSQDLQDQLKVVQEKPREVKLTKDILDETDDTTRRFVEAYAHDHIQPIQARADRAIEEAATLRESLVRSNQDQQRIMQQNQRLQEQVFFGNIAARVPNWEQVNVDPAFKTWLSEVDPFSGRQRQEVINAAYQAADANTVANIFQTYIGQSGQAIQPGPAQPPVQQQVQAQQQPGPISNPGYPMPQQAPSPALDPSQSIAPPRGRSTSLPDQAQADQQGTQWNAAMVAKLYQDKVNGRITPEEFKQYENDMFKAQAEGRLQA